ncbi:MAG: carbohydrate-binding family 9-like protein [Dysgonomonas sp.]|nr:carbohydrate-binding family 9-like protein [Dysgonomonas sp.]
MKKLIIPKINIDSTNIEDVADKLSAIPSNDIAVINWPNEFPSKPEVSFSIAHNGENILLQYKVHEDEILAAVKEDNGEVWTDSCVEFFITFDNEHYYNAEVTCIGKALLGYREIGGHVEHGSEGVMKSIRRLPTLGTENKAKEKGDFHWAITLVIPCTAYWESDIKSFDGIKAKGNFYKCGDNLTTPHFVSWAPIDTPSPSFHQPKFFGELEFEG